MLDTLLGYIIARAPSYGVRRLAQAAARWKLRVR